jgi:hypothetical protein
MVNPQHAHLAAAAGAGRFDRLAGSIEHFPLRHWPDAGNCVPFTRLPKGRIALKS